MYTIVTYTYPLLFLSFILFRKRLKDTDALLIAIYGAIAFGFLFLDIDKIAARYWKLYFTSYTCIEYFFFALLILRNIRSRSFKIVMVVLSASFFLFQILYYFVAKTGRLDSIPVGIESILMFIYIFMFYYESFKAAKPDYIYYSHCFWISTGILIYLGGAFFMYILANHVPEKELERYWDLTYVAEILKNLFFILAVYFYDKQSKNSSTGSPSTLPYLDMN